MKFGAVAVAVLLTARVMVVDGSDSFTGCHLHSVMLIINTIPPTLICTNVELYQLGKLNILVIELIMKCNIQKFC